MFVYSDQNNSCVEVPTIHNASVTLLEWSGAGSRLVSADSAGSVIGWSLDRSGQLNTIFHHELKDPLSQVRFRNADSGVNSAAAEAAGLDISNLARAAVAGDERALDLFSSWRPKTGGRRAGLGADRSNENLNFYVGKGQKFCKIKNKKIFYHYLADF